jgi:hypothetical protein
MMRRGFIQIKQSGIFFDALLKNLIHPVIVQRVAKLIVVPGSLFRTELLRSFMLLHYTINDLVAFLIKDKIVIQGELRQLNIDKLIRLC